MVRTCGTTGAHSSRIAERDRLDERDEGEIQSVHVAPFAHVSRVTRHDSWSRLAFSAFC